MLLKKRAKPTLTPFELNHGDILQFTKADGRFFTLTLTETGGKIVATDLKSLDQPSKAAKTIYSFYCKIRIGDNDYTLEREIPTQKSFYEPWVIDGVRIWFDAVSCIFQDEGGFLAEKDSELEIFCKPNKHARFAVQDASLDICPELLHPWMPLPEGGLKIADCYRGEDCWMGPYDGLLTHGGLDINHEVGLPLWAPIALDDQGYFNCVENGDSNNRWRGIRRWEDGSVWILQVHHMTELTAPQHTPLKKGEQFAKGAGIASGDFHHSHFVFIVQEEGERIFLDPWILFWRMYQS